MSLSHHWLKVLADSDENIFNKSGFLKNAIYSEVHLMFLWETVHFNTEWSKTVKREHLKATIINYRALKQNVKRGKTINQWTLNGKFHCI